MKHVLTYALLFIFLQQTIAQENLIPNPSFEEYIDCDYVLHDELETIIPDWFGLRRSPYYIRNNCPIFENPNFATQAQDGDAFLTGVNSVHLNTDVAGHQGRMYFQCELNKTLNPNSTYFLSFFVSVGATSSSAVSHLGVDFSIEMEHDPYYDNFPYYPYLKNPLLEIDTVIGPGTNFGEWTKVEWCFSPDTLSAIMQVGYFSPIDSIQYDFTIEGSSNFTGYDNFELYEVPSTAELTISPKDTICAGDCIDISTNHSLIPGSFYWTIDGGNIDNATSPSFTVCYDIPGTYDLVLNLNHCTVEIDTTFQDAITVVEPVSYEPTITEVFICPNETFSINLSSVSENITWNDNSQDKIRDLSIGNYDYILDNGYCSQSYSLSILPLFEIITDISSIQMCPRDTFWNENEAITTNSILIDTLFSFQQCDSIYIQQNIVFTEDFSTELGDFIQCPNEDFFLELPAYMQNTLLNNEVFNAPDFLNNPGTYSLQWEDENNCTYFNSFELVESDSSLIVITDFIDVELNNDLQIIPEYEGNIIAYQWNGPGSLSCYDCPFPYILSGDDGRYSIEVIDEFGCSFSTSLTVQFLTNEYYLANTFSPNSTSTENRAFYLQSKINVTYDMSIYDRWGNLIFKEENLQSNDANQAWNPGDKYNPQVFSYLIFIDYLGEQVKRVGTITLIK